MFYMETILQGEIMPSVEHLLAAADIQVLSWTRHKYSQSQSLCAFHNTKRMENSWPLCSITAIVSVSLLLVWFSKMMFHLNLHSKPFQVYGLWKLYGTCIQLCLLLAGSALARGIGANQMTKTHTLFFLYLLNYECVQRDLIVSLDSHNTFSSGNWYLSESHCLLVHNTCYQLWQHD